MVPSQDIRSSSPTSAASDSASPASPSPTSPSPASPLLPYSQIDCGPRHSAPKHR